MFCRGVDIGRHAILRLTCGAAAAWPTLARAQQAMPMIGVIGAGERGGFVALLVATRLGLKDFGFVEGQNFEFAYAFAGGRFDELPKLASDLVRRPVAVTISTGVGSGFAAKGATSPFLMFLSVRTIRSN